MHCCGYADHLHPSVTRETCQSDKEICQLSHLELSFTSKTWPLDHYKSIHWFNWGRLSSKYAQPPNGKIWRPRDITPPWCVENNQRIPECLTGKSPLPPHTACLLTEMFLQRDRSLVITSLDMEKSHHQTGMRSDPGSSGSLALSLSLSLSYSHTNTHRRWVEYLSVRNEKFQAHWVKSWRHQI